MTQRILLVDDDRAVAEIVREKVSPLGYIVDWEENGTAGLDRATLSEYALIILDVKMPGIDGYELCRMLRRENDTVPILFLSSQADEFDRVLGLELGADDYLVKPFGVRELLARVKTLLRRGDQLRNSLTSEPKVEQIIAGELLVDRKSHTVYRAGRELSLTPLEYDLLEFLALHPGRAFSREELTKHVWKLSVSSFDSTVTVHVSRLRNKIEPDPSRPTYIESVRGVGYRFAVSPEQEK